MQLEFNLNVVFFCGGLTLSMRNKIPGRKRKTFLNTLELMLLLSKQGVKYSAAQVKVDTANEILDYEISVQIQTNMNFEQLYM